MGKWYYSSALRINNFSIKNSNGNPVRYYRLPREESVINTKRFLKHLDLTGRVDIFLQYTGVLAKGKLLLIYLMYQYFKNPFINLR